LKARVISAKQVENFSENLPKFDQKMEEIPGKKLSILEPKMAKISGEKLTKIE
jgi:hypothetical protein